MPTIATKVPRMLTLASINFIASLTFVTVAPQPNVEFLDCYPNPPQNDTCKIVQCGYNARWTAWIHYQKKYTNFACCADRIYDMRKTVCQREHVVKCYEHETFRCATTHNCIDKDFVCNGINDCSDGSDEFGCKPCSDDQFRCTSGECVAKISICNQQKECSDGSDETYCARNDGGWCGLNRFRCREKCIPLRHVCDGTPDCLNGLDEENCNILCDPADASLDCFRGNCRNGQLFSVPRQKVGRDTAWGCCNGFVFDMRRRYCSQDHQTLEKCDLATSFWCNNGNCVDSRLACDGVNHCSDGSDEFGCFGKSDEMTEAAVAPSYLAACKKEQSFSCTLNGPCLPSEAVCDGVKDCAGGEDEMNCLTEDGGWCSPEWLRCPENQCLEREKICDGVVHCGEGYDEANCTAPLPYGEAGVYFTTTHLMYLLIGVAGFFSLLVFCLVGALCKYREAKGGKRRNEASGVDISSAIEGPETNPKSRFISIDSLRYIIDFKNDDGSMNTVQTSLSDVESLDVESQEKMSLLVDSKLIVSRDQIIVGPTIGRGHFGNVNKGSLHLGGGGGVGGGGPPIMVAVKTLHRTNSNAKGVNQFLSEALIMKDLKHPNVMQLSAMCLMGSDCPMVILPYMQNGNLLEFIRGENNSPNIGDMLKFALDIANGMSYLVGCRIIHRDLAARNCMLNSSFTVKVADFGLSRDVYEKEYYSKQDGRAKLPVRWMAIESVASGKYTYSSDVWSFGVLLWELMTRGNCPYSDVDNWDVVNYLKRGRRLAQPEYCPDDMYKIMLSCWHPTPESRPTFDEIIALISHMQTSLNPQENLPVTTDCDYKYVDLSNAYVNAPNALGNYQTLLSAYRDSQSRERDGQEDYYLQPVAIDLMDTSVEVIGGNAGSDRNSIPYDHAPLVPFDNAGEERQNNETAINSSGPSYEEISPANNNLPDRLPIQLPSPVSPKPPVPPKPKLKRLAQSQVRLSDASAAYVGSQYFLPKQTSYQTNTNYSLSVPNLLRSHDDHFRASSAMNNSHVERSDGGEGERSYCEFDPQ